MTVTSQRSNLADLTRSVVVVLLAILQVVVSGIGGSGAAGESIGVVANSYPSPLLAAGWTFVIWGPIYLGFLLYAGYQLLPGQRGRAVHRRTGWWLAASALLNPAWILAFAARLVPLAELFLVALLVVLATTFGRLSREPARDVTERVLFRGPVALYTGWVSLATVLGTAATGVWAGLPGNNAIATVAAVVVLLAAAAIAAWVIASGTAAVAYTAAVVWALAGIALNGQPVAVVGTAAVAILLVLAALARRVATAGNPPRAAWG